MDDFVRVLLFDFSISLMVDLIVQLRSVVVDGVTIGHPCCGVLNCPKPLDSVKDRYCPAHFNLDSVCAVISCNNDADPGYQTCSMEEHRSLKHYHQSWGKAMFQLKRRLKRARAIQINNSLPIGEELPEEDQGAFINRDSVCDGKPETGNKKPVAHLGRTWVHNEKLCMSSCGVILGRATFFGSEAPNGVCVSSVPNILRAPL